MSEQRRATLTPFGKSDKKSNKSPRKSFRFSFTLSDPSEDSCPVFDYGSVVKIEERKIIKKHREEKERKPNGINEPFNDEDEDVKRLARKFEEKYGDKKAKSKSYAELGAGYDETDPFIDNSEAHDETLQEDQETPCGGYYINSGPLELKRVEVSDQSDSDEVGKRRHKKGLQPIIEQEETVEKNGKEDDETVTEVKSVQDESSPLPKKVKAGREEIEESITPLVNDLEELLKKKKKRPISDEGTVGEVSLNKLKKAKTVKALLEEKRTQAPTTADEPKKQIASHTSISEAIESVVNAGNHDEHSNSSNTSQSATATTSASEDSQDGRPSSQVTPPPLPENLSADIVALVEHIKRTAAVTDNTRKTFCQDINSSLIKLEWKSRDFSATNRNLLFAHLACYLPCTKDTLMRRAKKLFVHKEESLIETIICKLKATIDATMPSLLEKYAIECQRITDEKGIPGTPNNANTSGEENLHTPDSAATKLPKRKFPWTDETRGYLKEIVRLKNRCFKVLKPRKSTNQDYVHTFLHSKIRALWPPGWMKSSVLVKESSRSPSCGKSKHSSTSSTDSPRLNVSVSYQSSTTSNGTAYPLYVSPSADVPSQPLKSPLSVSTPHVAKSTAEPLNLLAKITTSLTTSPNHQQKSSSPGHHHGLKSEKPETFLMDCLLKRTSETSDFSSTLAGLIQNDNVVMNGATLPFKNVNSSQKNNSGRNERILDLTSCNSSVSGTSVIQNVSSNERTTMRASDSVSLSSTSSVKQHTGVPAPSRKEVSSNLTFNRKQRLLQPSTQSHWHARGSCDNVINKETDSNVEWPHSTHKNASDSKQTTGLVERRLSDETTTATDILSQLISESLLAPSQPPPLLPPPSYNTKVLEDGKSETPPSKGQELFYDVMQDLKELNHLSSGGTIDRKQDSKINSYSGSWSHPSKSSESPTTNAYQNAFIKHVFKPQDGTLSSTPTPSYSRHTVSPFENSLYMNDINKSVYNSSPHRTAQSMSSHAGSPASKVSQINQGCIMKPLPSTGISSGHPHRYMSQMDYTTEDQHLLGLGLTSSLQYGLQGWPYSGSESQSHQ